MVSALLASTVRIRVADAGGASYGSGTIIDVHQREALVLTCGHLFRDSAGQGKITVDLFVRGQSHSAPAQLVRYDLDRDLGLVSFQPGVLCTYLQERISGNREGGLWLATLFKPREVS